jgi:hypothetical protein
METIPAKWFARAFLERTGLRFPEYCVYEATPIEDFVLPLLLTRYLKSEFQAYRAIAGPSITRGELLLAVSTGSDDGPRQKLFGTGQA